MATCGSCRRAFGTKASLAQHMKATRHCFCQHCKLSFASPEALGQHDSALHSWKCPQCRANFATKQALNQHQKAQRHCYCGDCNRPFPDAALLRQHLTASQHSSEFRCCDCNRNFISSEALSDHLRDKVHHGLPKRLRERQSGPCDCPKCHRKFRSATALQQHLNSLVHRPLSDLACIAHPSCKSRFRSPSALLHHLESGACRSGMNRQKINTLVLAKDTERIITTSPQHTAPPELDTAQRPRVDDGDTTVASSDVFILTPSSTVTSPHSSTPGCATPKSGSSFGSVAVSSRSRRCPLCPPHRRGFATERGLRDHLASPVHDPPIVHCPLPLLTTKATSGPLAQTQKWPVKTFTTVSGLAQHLESSACIGGLKSFWRATEYLETVMVRWGFKARLTIQSESPEREKMRM
ncbi:hypothetical protein MAPG_02370 [Magnaporthiopsis poae ATCC 64411]|uniref:C2H2-type domain-containing protein n=1 Tax=Magnaporthiopsis poae (strain ATCC 64411 / 73-15) TaxID=644358 RepID=A0A0C4DR67_MAGP6|nr:hypothetical protein MAPG_02370 [Magnaporthiopsis poae ATCC 64411]